MTLRIKTILFVLWASCLLCLPRPSFCDDKILLESPAKKENAPQDSYVYDLKSLINKSKDNIKRVNEKIKEQAVYRRNQLREEKAREYYDRAMELTEEGKIDEAQEFFEKSIRISEHAEMKDYVRLSEKRFKSQAKAMRKEEQDKLNLSLAQEKQRQEQVKESYNRGVEFFKRKKYREARDQFMLVEQLTPGFKATLSYLKLSEDGIASQETNDKVEQKKEILRQQKDAETARVREKEMWRKELELKERERQRKLKEQAAEVYSQAVKFYNEKNFLTAKEKFQEVEWVIPDYKATRKYLEKLDRDIKDHEQVIVAKTEGVRAKREWEDELLRKKLEGERKKEFQRRSLEEKQKAGQEAAIHYQKGKELMVQKKYADARDEFLTVEKMYPDYMATSEHLARLNKALGIIETAPEKVEEEVKVIYKQALEAYEQKDLPEAKSKFERVEFMYPDYQATRKYLKKLMEIQVAETQDRTDDPQDASGSAAGIPPKVGLEVNTFANDALVQKVEPLYVQALTLFEEKNFQESLKQFEMVESILPNYKSTRPYIKRVNHQIKKAEQERYKTEQMAQAEIINVLAKQASVLYQKISQLAGDRSMSVAQKKFAMVDKLFANLSREQARLLLEIAEEEEKLRLEEIAYEQEVQRSEFVNTIDPIYQEAVRLYQTKQYDAAKAKFLEAQSTIADYRSSKRYLSLIDKQNQLLQETMKAREAQISEYQGKAEQNAEMAAQMQIKAQESSMIRELVASAERINDEIVALSKERNFEAIKEKFAELEKIVDNLLTIQSVAAQRENKPSAKAGKDAPPEKATAEKPKTTSAEETDKSPVPSPASSDEDEQKTKRNSIDAQKIAKPRTSAQRRSAQKGTDNHLKKLQQFDRDNASIYKQGAQSYAAGNYSDAKSRFLSLEHNIKYGRAARKYIDKIDRMILHRQNLEIERQNRKRSDYIESRGQRDKMTFKVREAMRDNRMQKNQETRFTSPILNPSMRYSVSGRDYVDSLDLNLRQRPAVTVFDQEQVSQMKDVPSPEEELKREQPQDQKQDAEMSKGMSPNEDGSWLERRSQKKLSDRRKKYFEKKVKESEKSERMQKAVVPAKVSDQRLKEAARSSERQLSQEKKLRKLYEQELRRSKGPGGFDNALVALELENKAKNNVVPEWQKNSLRQQREEERSLREDKERQITNKIGRHESLKGVNLRSSPKDKAASSTDDGGRQSAPTKNGPSIEPNDKETVKRAFEDGLAKMYADALKDFRNHAYQEAREKFSGIEEIAPNYNRTRIYMERIDKELIREQQRREKLREGARYQLSEKTAASFDASKPPADPAATSPQRLDVISNALDVFETDQK